MRNFFDHFGPLGSAYRLAQRLIVLDITRLLVLDIAEHVAVRPRRPLELRTLTQEEVLECSYDAELEIDQDMARRLVADLDICVAAIDQGQVAGYLWIAKQGIEPEHNCGNHPLTGVALSYEPSSAFIYKAYSLASYRGMGIFPALLSFSARTVAQEQGFARLISTTDWTNTSALRGFYKCGFYSIGTIWRAAAFGFAVTWGPHSRKAFRIQLGERAVVPSRETKTERSVNLALPV